MALADVFVLVRCKCFGPTIGDMARIGTEAHGAALVSDVLLLRQQIDHILRVLLEFRGCGLRESSDITCKLNHGTLHAKADPEEGNILLTDMANGGEFSLDTTGAKTRGYQESVDTV